MRKTKFECDGHYIFDIHEGETPSPCEHLPFYKEYEGKRYCVLHFPKQEKLEHFEKALEEKLDRQDYNFRNIWIPDGAYFGRRCFQSQVDFSYAIFNGEANFEICTFEQEAIFDNVTFEADAVFNSAKFGLITSFFASKFNTSAIFTDTEFGDLKSKCEITFYEATFSGKANFSGAKFNCSVEFGSAKFHDSVSFEFSFFSSIGDFKDALFKDYVKFSGEYFRFPCEGEEEINKVFKDESSLNLQFAVFEKPEKVLFHTTLLQPHWFVNTDPRKFEFTDVEWKNLGKREESVKFEIEDLTSRRYENLASPYTLFAIVCKRLASNAEENNRYDEASCFRRMALENERLERKEKRKIWLASFNHSFTQKINCSNFFSYSGTAIKDSWSLIRNFPSDVLHFLYRIFSGYGESWFRAFCWLIAIWLFSAFLYATPICDFIEKEKYSFSYWIGYSLNVITLQRPEPKPANAFTMIILGLEVLFAPIQAALLILAVRRKFMR